MPNSVPPIIATDREPIGILPRMSNRHGLIAGATGTGKTVTLSENPAGELLQAAAKSAAHAIGSQLGRQIMRGILGSIFGGKRGR